MLLRASGVADIVVDITTTGSTLAANGLRVLEDGVMLRSEACLIVSRTADWSADRRAVLDQVLGHIGIKSGL